VIAPDAPKPGRGETGLVGPGGIVAEPLDGATGPSRAAAAADGSLVYVLTPVRGKGEDRLAVRKVVGGRLERDGRPRAESPPVGVSWTLPAPVAVAPLLLPGSETAPGGLLVADATGGVWLFAADRGGEPLRRWRPDGKLVPLGKPTAGFAVQTAPNGGRWAAY